MIKSAKILATTAQKENFRTRFAEIVLQNRKLHHNYSINFFDTAFKSNYVIQGSDGKSMNVVDHLSVNELEQYRLLKKNWLG